MKKLLLVLLSGILALSLVGCGTSTPTETTEPEDTTAGPSTETFEELLKAGIENGNKLTVYTTHSVIEDAIKAFALKYDVPAEMVEATQIGDTTQITQVATESEANVPGQGADLIFIQDGGRTVSELVEPGYVYNWYNEEIAASVGFNCEPLLVWDFCNKVFIYNNATMTEGIDNIWYATDPQYAGTVKLKDPSSEGVNMNFLIQLTQDDNAAKLAEAYKAYYGSDIVLDEDCKNAGYQFIKMMYKNGLVLGSSDGTIAKEIGDPSAETKMSGYLTLNKYVKTAKSSVEINGEQKNYNLDYAKTVNPVAGFVYPIYGLQVTNADNPELAKAFLIWLFTEEGWVGNGELTTDGTTVYKGMQGRFGDYSGNENLKVTDGDQPMSEWRKVLIVEDAAYCAEYRADVEDFITLIK